ncbi:unnamed protein product [Spirodela intermedia]|uniref:Glutamine amidotransferase domain-containing protein n=1 Tax=Spirodela intermedia TaxID=51605 RepID=A0A7I8IZ27_SPIIN|nr:unnamed protein product [Spirodela intermedia]CAA6662394.1 unnamed protein product [Spirodela intermedia]
MASTDPCVSSHRLRRFAVLKTGHGSDYTERAYGGYAQMIVWDIFSVIEGDFSFLEHGGDDYYDGYVITGSAADAHATDVDWINCLCDALVLHRQGKRLLGICFGHQILARALGGKTGRAEVGWEVGVKSLQVDSEKVSHLYGLAFPSTVRAIESHQDQVTSRLNSSPGAVQLASSERTKVEMFAVGDHVLGMQCHPEFSEDVMIDLINSRISRKIISDGVAKEALESFQTGQADQDLLIVLCKTFLKRCRE